MTGKSIFGDVLGNSIAQNNRQWFGRTPSPTTASGIPVSPVGRGASGNPGPDGRSGGAGGTWEVQAPGGYANDAEVEIRPLRDVVERNAANNPAVPTYGLNSAGEWIPVNEVEPIVITGRRPVSAGQLAGDVGRGFVGVGKGLMELALMPVDGYRMLAHSLNGTQDSVQPYSDITKGIKSGDITPDSVALSLIHASPAGMATDIGLRDYRRAAESAGGMFGGAAIGGGVLAVGKGAGTAANAGKQFLVDNAASMVDDFARRGVPVLPFPNAPRMPMAAYAVPVDDVTFGMRATVSNSGDDFAKGLKPLNSPAPDKWINKGGTVWNEFDGTWVYKDQSGNVVRYPQGYPDFSGGGYVRQSVNIETVPNHTTDFNKANKAAPLGPKLPENTWHHHQNGTTMEEVNKIIHSRFTHRGGVSIKKGGQ